MPPLGMAIENDADMVLRAEVVGDYRRPRVLEKKPAFGKLIPSQHPYRCEEETDVAESGVREVLHCKTTAEEIRPLCPDIDNGRQLMIEADDVRLTDSEIGKGSRNRKAVAPEKHDTGLY